MHKVIIFFILSAVLSMAQQSMCQNVIRYKLTDFPVKEQLKGEKLKLNDELLIPISIIQVDSFLILQNRGISPAFDVINLNTKKIAAKFCHRGRGPGELIAPFLFQPIPNTREIMVQDINGKKIVFFSLDSILNNAPVKHTRIVHIDKEILVAKVNMLDDGNFICYLIGHKDGHMSCLIDSNGKLVRFLNKFPKADFRFDPVMGNNVFGISLATSSDLKKVVVPYFYMDIIDIFNSQGKHELQLVGPNLRRLDVVQTENGATLTNGNNSAFNKPSVGRESFMIPYIGRSPRFPEPSLHTQQLFWISNDGKLLKHFELSVPISHIAVDWKNRVIYGINIEMEPAIYTFRF